jgi:hypothetical protein
MREFSAQSTFVDVTVLDPSAPLERPINLVATHIDGGIRLTWDAVIFADGYRIQRHIAASNEIIFEEFVQVTQFQDNGMWQGINRGLQIGQTYRYLVNSYRDTDD